MSDTLTLSDGPYVTPPKEPVTNIPILTPVIFWLLLVTSAIVRTGIYKKLSDEALAATACSLT